LNIIQHNKKGTGDEYHNDASRDEQIDNSDIIDSKENIDSEDYIDGF
jgi:hypothetical protein